MSCYINEGFTLGCRDNTGGVRALWILGTTGTTEPSLDVVTHDVTSEIITALEGDGIFYKFELTKQTSTLTETINASLENGTIFYQADLTAVFHKLEQDKRNQIKLLSQSPDLKIVVEDQNGSQFLVGEVNGATLTAGSGSTGTAFGDRNGYELTFTAMEPAPMSELQGGLAGITLTGITYEA